MPLTDLEAEKLIKGFKKIFELQTTAALLAVAKRATPNEFLAIFGELGELNKVTKMLPASFFDRQSAEVLFTEARELVAEQQDQRRAALRKGTTQTSIHCAAVTKELDQIKKRLDNVRRSRKR
jgi:hypothetical protein